MEEGECKRTNMGHLHFREVSDLHSVAAHYPGHCCGSEVGRELLHLHSAVAHFPAHCRERELNVNTPLEICNHNKLTISKTIFRNLKI